MVLCDLYLKRFDLTKVWLFDTFPTTVWYKLCRYDHSVLELESFLPPRKQETSNQMHPGLNCEKNVPQARFFMKKNVPWARILDEVLMGTLSY